ncbi:ABC-type nitrate/sulfonate/bicarbonate transport system substrate-binding protein [Sagittula marina]|uniref:Thiamine pyrimidine synthase n=1 Tax=Sagittula marina TaxID=943940 RepID=A0A7W6GR46_9RHOB|nr:ABC transporter substrate-binding protein [Sagittula marina]MBB3984198.1 ABC-type nitrate/sulfonate/bicarbonate transport system substrate-binding protein [Sagittula marina]
MERFLVSATGHSLNYLPHYLAEERGFFRDEGLDVSEVVPRPWDLVLDHIRDGTAEAALGGIWVPSMFHGRGRRLVPFAQVSNRAPLALVGRTSAEAFNAAALVGKTVLMKGSNGASVGLYLKMMLREAGIDPKSVNYVQDLDGGILQACFAGGMGISC